MLESFKVEDLIEVCGDVNIEITDFNKVKADYNEIIYWKGETDDYFKERPYGKFYVQHIMYDNDTTLRIMIDIDEHE